jgi:chromate transporter
MLPNKVEQRVALPEVALVFARLSCLGFGGAAGLTALMHEETVARRHWLDEQTFLDLLAVSNLLPGLGAAKLALYIGYFCAGWGGLLAAGFFLSYPRRRWRLSWPGFTWPTAVCRWWAGCFTGSSRS